MVGKSTSKGGAQVRGHLACQRTDFSKEELSGAEFLNHLYCSFVANIYRTV